MNSEELKEKLKKAGLNKKEFAKEVGLTYQTVNNWGCSKSVPHWVESWLNLYIETRLYKDIKDKLLNSGLCEALFNKSLHATNDTI